MPKIQRVLIVIKQNGFPNRSTIIERVKLCGYTILQSKTIQLTFDQATEFYAAYCHDPYYPFHVSEIFEKPIHVMCLGYPEPDDDRIELHHADRFRHVVLMDFAENIFVSDDRGDLEFFFDIDGKHDGATCQPTIECVSDYLNEHIHPVLMRALKELTDENVSADQCLVELAKKLLAANAGSDKSWLRGCNRSEILIRKINDLYGDLKARRLL